MNAIASRISNQLPKLTLTTFKVSFRPLAVPAPKMPQVFGCKEWGEGKKAKLIFPFGCS
jgi:hypothetical protein